MLDSLKKKELSKKLGIPLDFMDLLDQTDRIIEVRSNGQVYNTIKDEVAICYDKDGYILLKIGELNDILGYFEQSREDYLKLETDIGSHMARNIAVITIPKNQELVDRIFSTTGYIEIYIKRVEKIINELKIQSP